MHEHDWFYRVYEKDTSPDVFGPFAPFIRLWRSHFDGDKLPEWTEFDVDDFIGWYGNVSLGELEADCSNMVFRLWGTDLVDLWGSDYTGKVFANNKFPEHWKNVEQPYVEAIVKRNGIGICGGTLHRLDREFINITFVDLPVSRAGKAPFLMSAYLRDVDRSGLDTAAPAYSYIEEFVDEPSWQRVDPSDSLP